MLERLDFKLIQLPTKTDREMELESLIMVFQLLIDQ